MKRIHSYKINFNDAEMQAITLLMKQHVVTTPQELMRILINQEHKQSEQDRLRYGKSDRLEKAATAKERVGDLMVKMKAMDDDSLTNYLIELGYFRKPELTDPEMISSTRMKADRIMTDEMTNNQMFIQVHYDQEKPEKILYSRTVFLTLEDIIKDMQKEKII